MRTLSEIFEYLENSNPTTINKELDELGRKLIEKHGDGADLYYKERIHQIQNLCEKMGTHFRDRFKVIQKGVDNVGLEELLELKDVGKELKLSVQSVKTLIDKGKLHAIDVGTVDKPNARKQLRVRREDLKKYLKG